MSPVLCFEEMRLPMELLAISLVFLLPFAEKKPRFRLRAAIGYVFLTLFSLLYFVIFGPVKEAPRFIYGIPFWYSLMMLSAYAYARFCFQIGKCDALFFTISASFSQNIVYCLYHCFFARIVFPTIREWLPLYILGAALVTAGACVLLHLIFARTLSKADGRIFDDARYISLILIAVFIVMMVCILFYQNAFENRTSVFDTLAWLSGILICLFLLLIQYAVICSTQYWRETVVLENLLRGSERYYELAKEQIAIINRKCHDLKHQLKALEHASDADRAEYIREAQESVDFYRHLVYTDNEALNTILAEKGLFCRDKGIDFGCAVDDVDLSFMRLPDLYALLGNAIDNAIEYTEAQTDPSMRTVSLRISHTNGFIGIQIANPYAGEAVSDASILKTHKQNPSEHGFGLKSIRYLSEKYGGTMVLSAADGLFTLQILLPNKE